MTNLPHFSQFSPDEIKTLNVSSENKGEKTKTAFIFDAPFLTKMEKGNTNIAFIKTDGEMTINQFFDLYLKANDEFEDELNSDFKNTQALLKFLGVKRQNSMFTAEAIDVKPISASITFPVIINSDLTTSGWIDFCIIATDNEHLLLSGGWVEHDHTKGTQKVWHFENCSQDLVETFRKCLKEITNTSLPFVKNGLFDSFEETSEQSVFIKTIKENFIELSY